MNIQPTIMSNSYCVNFEGKRKTTNLPKELKAKPKFTPSKFSLLSLACIGLLSAGNYLYRQTDQYLIKEWLKESMKLSEIKNDSTYPTPQDTIKIQERMNKLMQKLMDNHRKKNTSINDNTTDTISFYDAQKINIEG